MSRAPLPPQQVTVAPSSNVYTALAAVGTVATLLGLIVIFLKAKEIFEKGLL